MECPILGVGDTVRSFIEIIDKASIRTWCDVKKMSLPSEKEQSGRAVLTIPMHVDLSASRNFLARWVSSNGHISVCENTMEHELILTLETKR